MSLSAQSHPGRLAHTVQLHDNETLASFCSRLAAANGVKSAWEFCSHMGLNFQHIVDGDTIEVLDLCRLAGQHAPDMRERLIRTGGHGYSLRGETLLRSNLVRNRLRACPHCLDEDRTSDLYAEHGRAEWLVSFIRSCPRHSARLAVAQDEAITGTLHDFVSNVRAARDRWEAFVKEATDIDTSKFESYVLERLRGQTTGTGWLDSLPLYAACTITEIVGATMVHGHRFISNALTDDDWSRAAACGFEVTSQGVPAVTDFIETLHRNFWNAKGDFGGRKIYGRLYEFLAHENNDPAYDSMRDLMIEGAFAKLPIGTPHQLFGRTEKRRWHSVRSASQKYDLHHITLRKALLAAGLISSESSASSDSREIVDADVMERFVERLKSALPARDAATYINARRTTWDILVSEGHVRPLTAPSAHGAAAVFPTGDLDRFLELLFDRVTVSRGRINALIPLRDAAKQANCRLREILEPLVAGRLSFVARDPNSKGFESILVDLGEVRSIVTLENFQGMTLRQAERTLKTTTVVLRKLVELGYLATETAINPVSRCAQTIVRDEEIARFQATHRSLYAHAVNIGVHIRTAKKLLQDSGIQPSIQSSQVGSTYFLVSELATVSQSHVGHN